MIYHYFGSKDRLFAAVVADAYRRIRKAEQDLCLDDLPPMKAIERLVEFTWSYYLENPGFIRLVNSVNLHKARHIKGQDELRKLQQEYVALVRKILTRGVREGVFRRGIDPIQLCVTIAAVGYYYLTNSHSGSYLFGIDFMQPDTLEQRLQFNLKTIANLVRA